MSATGPRRRRGRQRWGIVFRFVWRRRSDDDDIQILTRNQRDCSWVSASALHDQLPSSLSGSGSGLQAKTNSNCQNNKPSSAFLWRRDKCVALGLSSWALGDLQPLLTPVFLILPKPILRSVVFGGFGGFGGGCHKIFETSSASPGTDKKFLLKTRAPKGSDRPVLHTYISL